MVAFKISKHDLQNKIPSEFRHSLELHSKEKNKWLQNRVKSITNSSKIIYSQDPKQGVYDTVMNHLLSQYPQATSNAVKSFTRHHISITGMENRGRIIKSVSTNHRKINSDSFSQNKKVNFYNSALQKDPPKTCHMRRRSYFHPKKHLLPLAASFYPSRRFNSRVGRARKFNDYTNAY